MIEPLRLSLDVACSAEHAFETWTQRTSMANQRGLGVPAPPLRRRLRRLGHQSGGASRAHSMQNTLSGTALSRFGAIGRPQLSQTP